MMRWPIGILKVIVGTFHLVALTWIFLRRIDHYGVSIFCAIFTRYPLCRYARIEVRFRIEFGPAAGAAALVMILVIDLPQFHQTRPLCLCSAARWRRARLCNATCCLSGLSRCEAIENVPFIYFQF